MPSLSWLEGNHALDGVLASLGIFVGRHMNPGKLGKMDYRRVFCTHGDMTPILALRACDFETMEALSDRKLPSKERREAVMAFYGLQQVFGPNFAFARDLDTHSLWAHLVKCCRALEVCHQKFADIPFELPMEWMNFKRALKRNLRRVH